MFIFILVIYSFVIWLYHLALMVQICQKDVLYLLLIRCFNSVNGWIFPVTSKFSSFDIFKTCPSIIFMPFYLSQLLPSIWGDEAFVCNNGHSLILIFRTTIYIAKYFFKHVNVLCFVKRIKKNENLLFQINNHWRKTGYIEQLRLQSC